MYFGSRFIELKNITKPTQNKNGLVHKDTKLILIVLHSGNFFRLCSLHTCYEGSYNWMPCLLQQAVLNPGTSVLGKGVSASGPKRMAVSLFPHSFSGGKSCLWMSMEVLVSISFYPASFGLIGDTLPANVF